MSLCPEGATLGADVGETSAVGGAAGGNGIALLKDGRALECDSLHAVNSQPTSEHSHRQACDPRPSRRGSRARRVTGGRITKWTGEASDVDARVPGGSSWVRQRWQIQRRPLTSVDREVRRNGRKSRTVHARKSVAMRLLAGKLAKAVRSSRAGNGHWPHYRKGPAQWQTSCTGDANSGQNPRSMRRALANFYRSPLSACGRSQRDPITEP